MNELFNLVCLEGDSAYALTDENFPITVLTKNYLIGMNSQYCNFNYRMINRISKKCAKLLKRFNVLNFSYNLLSNFMNLCGKNSVITELYINNNCLCGSLCISNTLSSIKVIDVSNNRLENVIISVIGLQSFKASNNNIKNCSIKSDCLTALHLENNSIDSLKNIFAPSLQILDVSDNVLLTLDIFADHVNASFNMLSCINIYNNRIISLISSNNMLTACHVRSDSIMKLDISNNSVSELTLNTPSLLVIDASVNRLKNVDLSMCCNVISINFSYNTFDNNFVPQKYGCKMNQLEVMNLYNNQFNFIELCEEECSVCLDNMRVFHIFIYCMHKICINCYSMISKCPICRGPKFESMFLTFNSTNTGVYIDI